MTAALGLALFFTVALLAVTIYSIMGSVPLLVLKHDTPMDSRFIRGFFNTYYLVATCVAGAAAASYALVGRPALAIGGAVVAVVASVLRKLIVTRMDSIRARLRPDDGDAIKGFRQVHIAAVMANLAQLVLIVGSLIALSIQMK